MCDFAVRKCRSKAPEPHVDGAVRGYSGANAQVYFKEFASAGEEASSVETDLSCLSSWAIASSCDTIIPKNSASVNITQSVADITYDRYRTCCSIALVGSMLMPFRNQPIAKRRPNAIKNIKTALRLPIVGRIVVG